MRIQKIAASTAAVLVFLMLAACSNNVLSPQFQPEITNETDSFGFQATAII